MTREQFYRDEYKPTVNEEHKAACRAFAVLMVGMFAMVGVWTVVIQLLAWWYFGEPF